MYGRIAVIVGISAAGLMTGTVSANAAPRATTAATAPSVANTTQTIFLSPNRRGVFKHSAAATFTASTFTIPKYGDSGTFTASGDTIILLITKAPTSGDNKCKFTGTYSASTTQFAGSYTCPGGFKSTFALTTSGT